MPYGESFVSEHTTSTELPYLFNGKSLDEETGLYYYGARYFTPSEAVWYGVDILWEKQLNISPYVYCSSNPINRIDTDGMLDYEWEYLLNTRDLVKVSNEGGEETQYVTAVFYDRHGDEHRGKTHTVEGKKAYVYELRDKQFILTNYDADFDDRNYNKHTKYEYSKRDFDLRNKHRQLGSVFYRATKQTERAGKALPVQYNEFHAYFGADADIMTVGIWLKLGLESSDSPSIGGGGGVNIKGYNGGRVSRSPKAGATSSGRSTNTQPKWMQNMMNKMLKGKSISKGDMKKMRQHFANKELSE